MPYTVNASFQGFFETITIGGDLKATAKARRDKIAELLAGKFSTLDVIATGSLVRGTALRGVSDADVLVVLHYGKHVEGKGPTAVLEAVRHALASYNAKMVKKNGQAVTLYFSTWPNVDLVPAHRVNGQDYLNIPDANNGTWIRTNPQVHDTLIAQLSRRHRELMRMAKCWNHAHSGYLQAFHLEQIAARVTAVWDGGEWEDDSWPWALRDFFRTAIELTEPASDISGPYSTDDWSEFRDRLRRGETLSDEAWSAARNGNVRTAVDRLRVLFGNQFPAYG
ncbi:MAG: nucleotidyltransferase [Proteobacteria bacterium]|nr:nucleotidyltransferase [Pseudomonadota bacterium]